MKIKTEKQKNEQPGLEPYELICPECNKVLGRVFIPVDFCPKTQAVCINCVNKRDYERFEEITRRRENEGLF